LGQLVALGIADGPATFHVRVRVTDAHGNTATSAPMPLLLDNVAPAASIQATGGVTTSGHGVRGFTVIFTLGAADPSPADQAGTFTFQIDWDGNGTWDQTVAGPVGTTVSRSFPDFTGTQALRVCATDRDGAVGPVFSTSLTIDSAGVVAGQLLVGGTSNRDTLALQIGTGGIDVSFGSGSVGTFSPTAGVQIDGFGPNSGFGDQLTVRGTAGNDLIQVGNGSLTVNGLPLAYANVKTVKLQGGAGNDTFQLLPGGGITGSLDGQGGRDTLNYSLLGTPVQVTLTAVASTGSTGTAPGIGTTFRNVESVTGGSGSDTLVGPNTVTLFNVTGVNGGNLTSAATLLRTPVCHTSARIALPPICFGHIGMSAHAQMPGARRSDTPV
jgi:hypothetical protein